MTNPRFHTALEPLLVPIDTVTQHPRNPNVGNMDAIIESINANGYIAPVIAQTSTGYIIAGNHRWAALNRMGATHIPVIYVDINDTDAVRYMLADNKTAAMATPDPAALLELLDELAANDTTIGTGYNDRDMDVLMRLVAADNYMGSDWRDDATAAFYDDANVDNGTDHDNRAHHVIRIKTETPEHTEQLFAYLGITYDPTNPRRELWYPTTTPHYRESERFG